MGLVAAFNLFEACLWFALAAVCAVKSRRAEPPNARLLRVLAAALVVFGISDLIEYRTGAWWKPWWLFVVKTACVVVMAGCWYRYRRPERVFTRRVLLRWLGLGGVGSAILVGCWSCMILMPGRSFRGPLPPMTDAERALSASLRRDVEMLASTIGERNVFRHDALQKSADYLEARLRESGLPVSRQTYQVHGLPCHNLEAELKGSDEIVIVGGHYDSVYQCPGANDNATGAAGVAALADLFAGRRTAKTLRFVAFVNEEPPYFQTSEMGSVVYARRCRERGEKVAAMISLETIGSYSDREGSQEYPFPVNLFYPSRGDFVGFVGNLGSRSLVRRAIGAFRGKVSFPSEGAALPEFLQGVGWSDHWSFWREGYPAIMVTDTAVFRYAHYHTREDTVDKVDFDRCARVIAGMAKVVEELAR